MHATPTSTPHRVRLAAGLRRLLAGVTEREASASLLASMTAHMDGTRGRLEAHPRRLRHVGVSRSCAPGSAWEFDHGMRDFSPLSGAANPLAPPLDLRTASDRVHGTVRFSAPFAGPGGSAHTGYVAACFDEILGAAMSLNGRPGMTGILETQIRQPVPIGPTLTLEGWIRRIRGPLVFTDGTLKAGAQEVARAHGIFFLIDASVYHRLAEERSRRIRAGS